MTCRPRLHAASTDISVCDTGMTHGLILHAALNVISVCDTSMTYGLILHVALNVIRAWFCTTMTSDVMLHVALDIIGVSTCSRDLIRDSFKRHHGYHAASSKRQPT